MVPVSKHEHASFSVTLMKPPLFACVCVCVLMRLNFSSIGYK